MFPQNSSLVPTRCKACGRELASTELACVQCHTLVHGDELTALSQRASVLEDGGNVHQAIELWKSAFPLLPGDSTQADWVRNHIEKLELSLPQVPAAPPKEHRWLKRLGPLAPVAAVLLKAKSLFVLLKLKFLFSLGAFLAFYWSIWGWRFGLGFAVLILIHEMGHYIDIRRRGLPAEMPVFLPGLGAYVKWQALGVSLRTRAEVSLAGPLAGCLASAVCCVIWWKTGLGIWAGLARTSAWLNALNLIPVWILDGGQAIHALDKSDRWILLCSSVALWVLTRESAFALVSAGVIWRLFTKDFPLTPSRSTLAYYVSVLAALGLFLWLLPGQSFGAP